MKIEAKTGIVILHVSDIMASHHLDPIRITLEDIEPGKGRINIECYGKAWASYWGAMGKQTIAQFFAGCDNGYLISNLAPGLHGDHFTSDALTALCKRTIRARRKGTGEWRYDRLTKAQAAELMERLELLICETEADCWRASHFFESVFGLDGVQMAVQAREPNPEYTYLSRICDAVRAALCEHAKTADVEVAA